ncbi:ATP-binding protein [Streptomyces olivaceus]|uniref:ATP-binding protein n=1 Tax=Streptomyces olivaceus TaxID=47716 RepID=UPI0024912480|nr:ATP-binding protein [Streptomyces olivaceus]
MTIAPLSRPALSPSRHTSLDLAHHPRSCALARQWASGVLTQWATAGEAADDVLLVVSELVTNAVQHACGPIRACLGLGAGGSLHVQVDDGGPAVTAPAGHAPDEHGRGLAIVECLAARHGQDEAPRPYRTRSWATLAGR